MIPAITVKKCFDEGFLNLKANFWEYALIVIIIGIVDSIGNGPVYSQGHYNDDSQGMFFSIIAIFIKPVFDFGARLQFVRGNRGEPINVKEIVRGFYSKAFYIDIILTNIMVLILIFVGILALVLPGIYVFSRLVLSSYLVMDKGLSPRKALNASWELTRDYWPTTLALAILSCCMVIIGLLLFIIGIIPALIWCKAMFASFYQQIIDSHDEKFLLRLDIEP